MLSVERNRGRGEVQHPRVVLVGGGPHHLPRGRVGLVWVPETLDARAVAAAVAVGHDRTSVLAARDEAVAVGVRRGAAVHEAVVAGALKVPDLVAERVVARDAALVRHGEGR